MEISYRRPVSCAAGAFLASIVLGLAGCNERTASPAAVTPSTAANGVTVVTYAIEGMHCSGCAEAIVAEVGEVKGVKGVQCTFESKQATIELTDAAAAAEAERAITKLGYKIAPAAPSSK